MKYLSLFCLVSASSALLAQTPTPVVRPGSVPIGSARPTVWLLDQAPVPALTINPKSGLWVNINEMQKVYGLDQLTAQGAGATIAIVDAYDSPNAELDLNTFSTLYSLPACTTANGCFTKVSQRGGSDIPARNSGWEVEINLDTQWVHAIAPLAKIILVEADSNNDSDLFIAEAYAASVASVVSNSWSGGEYPGQSADWDQYMNQPYVTYLASSGDSGGFIGYPSTSAKVIAVGGTTLGIGSKANHYPVLFPVVETGWSGSGGGCSAYTPSLAFQKPLVPTICKRRAVPDISMDADPNSGVLVQVSLQGGYYRVGGTSLACPMMAAVVGIANGVRQTGGKLALSNTLQHLYDNGMSATYVRDITSGKAGLWPFVWNATVGFDFVTGLGVPVANNLVPYLVSLQ
jgi:subtilase family serine protease